MVHNKVDEILQENIDRNKSTKANLNYYHEDGNPEEVVYDSALYELEKLNT